MIKDKRLLNHPALDEISDERDLGDGIWFYLKPGFCTDENCNTVHHESSCLHQIHEDTVTEIRAKLKGIRPCDCEGCKRALEQLKGKA